MQLFSYLKGLFHRITKGQIKASCDAVIESLQKHTLPAYITASELFKSRKPSSKEAKDFAAAFSKNVGNPRGSQTFIDSIRQILENSVVMLTQIGEKSETLFSDTESTLGMTFQKAMYLRLISAATFMDDYARKFLDYLYVCETAHLDPNGSPLQGSLTPAQREWVEANFDNFCKVLDIMSKDGREVFKQVDELPDAIVSEQAEHTLMGSLGNKRIDPLGMRGLGLPVTIKTSWNPFWTLWGTFNADFRASQYKCAKEELDLLQMRKLNLEKLYAKQGDARLQQQIEYMAERVAKLQFELHEMEKKYA